MTKPNNLHHVAIQTGDMKKQIEFFSDVLNMELLALYWMHGAEGAWHAFMKLGEGSVAFVFIPENSKIESTVGLTHAGSAAGASAPGTMQHLSLNVATQEDLLKMRDRIRSRGVPVLGPIHHGLCTSIYFAGPENLTLELATDDHVEHPLNGDGVWLDPEVVKFAGISEEELQHFRNPEPYESPSEPVPQPAYDPSKPHVNYPLEMYKRLLSMPDEVVTETSSDTTPPNKK